MIMKHFSIIIKRLSKIFSKCLVYINVVSSVKCFVLSVFAYKLSVFDYFVGLTLKGLHCVKRVRIRS